MTQAATTNRTPRAMYAASASDGIQAQLPNLFGEEIAKVDQMRRYTRYACLNALSRKKICRFW